MNRKVWAHVSYSEPKGNRILRNWLLGPEKLSQLSKFRHIRASVCRGPHTLKDVAWTGGRSAREKDRAWESLKSTKYVTEAGFW